MFNNTANMFFRRSLHQLPFYVINIVCWANIHTTANQYNQPLLVQYLPRQPICSSGVVSIIYPIIVFYVTNIVCWTNIHSATYRYWSNMLPNISLDNQYVFKRNFNTNIVNHHLSNIHLLCYQYCMLGQYLYNCSKIYSTVNDSICYPIFTVCLRRSFNIVVQHLSNISLLC